VVDVETGAIEQRLDYDEFGNVLANTSPGFQPFGFAGGLYDGATGLVRFGAREFDPSIGRWISNDPIRFEGGDANLYAYSVNDPVNRLDPSGTTTDYCSGCSACLAASAVPFAHCVRYAKNPAVCSIIRAPCLFPCALCGAGKVRESREPNVCRDDGYYRYP
jgi:RHS repeat-associated protein